MFCYNFLKRVGRITIIRDEIIFHLSPLLIINIHIFSRDMKKKQCKYFTDSCRREMFEHLQSLNYFQKLSTFLQSFDSFSRKNNNNFRNYPKFQNTVPAVDDSNLSPTLTNHWAQWKYMDPKNTMGPGSINYTSLMHCDYYFQAA